MKNAFECMKIKENEDEGKSCKCNNHRAFFIFLHFMLRDVKNSSGSGGEKRQLREA
jgi:hypothetical protein